MSLGSILKSIFGAGGFFSRLFKNIQQHADVLAISVTEAIKTALNGSVPDFLAGIIDSLTKSNIAEDVLKLLKNYIPKILAAELAIQGLPENATADDILAFEQSIMKAFNVTDDKSKLYTTLAAQIYGIIQKTVNNTDGKFADWVEAVEEAYQDYLADQEGDTSTN